MFRLDMSIQGRVTQIRLATATLKVPVILCLQIGSSPFLNLASLSQSVLLRLCCPLLLLQALKLILKVFKLKG